MSSDNQRGNIKFCAREIECIQQLCKGKSPIDICKDLGISENTVRFYVRNGTKKLVRAVSLELELE